MTTPFYSHTLFSHTPPPLPPLQVVNVFSISEMIKCIFAVQGANADCQLVSFSYFYLVIVQLPPVNIINLVHMCLRPHIGEGRQFSGNICTMVNLFDKAVAEGAR